MHRPHYAPWGWLGPDDADAPIETVVEGNGGDPATARGTEGHEMSRYLTDDAVKYAVPNAAEGEVTE